MAEYSYTASRVANFIAELVMSRDKSSTSYPTLVWVGANAVRVYQLHGDTLPNSLGGTEQRMHKAVSGYIYGRTTLLAVQQTLLECIFEDRESRPEFLFDRSPMAAVAILLDYCDLGPRLRHMSPSLISALDMISGAPAPDTVGATMNELAGCIAYVAQNRPISELYKYVVVMGALILEGTK